MFNRLWPLAVGSILAGAIGFFFPQLPVVATGFFLLVGLLWRRQSSAVAAIEGRDGVEFWFDRTSPLGAPKLLRLPGLRRSTSRLSCLVPRWSIQDVDVVFSRACGSRASAASATHPRGAYSPRLRVSQARRAVATP